MLEPILGGEKNYKFKGVSIAHGPSKKIKISPIPTLGVILPYYFMIFIPK